MRLKPAAAAAILALVLLTAGAQPPAQQACIATPAAMTPRGFRAVSAAPGGLPSRDLRTIADVPLNGPANRFDYQSIDTTTNRLYISHMNAGRLVVFDMAAQRVVTEMSGVERATGVWAVPAEHAVYVSAAGRHELVGVDDRTLRITARIGGISFPDGIAYAPAERKVFVSDEAGEADVVVDAVTNLKLSSIALGGEAGNTHYDSVSHCILVAVQTRNQLVAIDPASERVVARYDLRGADGPHGFVLDEAGRFAFVTGEGNGLLQVVDLRTMRIIEQARVGDDPDVVAWDPAWRRLYVAAESGVLSAFSVDASGKSRLLAEVRAPHAHTVAVDPRTHRVYLPLENVGGRPVLRILAWAPGG
jgi:DNA-binding beta-propeller fold protein YncE